MARPRKAPEERRCDQLGVRLTTAERAEVEQHAAALGMSAAEFARRRSLDYRLPSASVAEQRHTARLAVALLRIGVNLNQLAHRVNAGREPPPDYLRALADRINALLDDIYGPGDSSGRAIL